MCVGSILSKPPRPPRPLPDDASVLEQRKRIRAQQQRQIAEDKAKQFEMRVNAYSGRAGRRSLLTGSGGS